MSSQQHPSTPSLPGFPPLDDEATTVDGKRGTPVPERTVLSVNRMLASRDIDFDARYELRELLGMGSCGSVYSAWDRDLEREIAVKVVDHPDEQQRELFVSEAQVTARLGHPNVPPLYDAGETHGGSLYMTMWRVPGKSLGVLLRDAIAQGKTEVLPLGTLLELTLKLCDTLAYVHARGIVHCDIKPDNIVLGDFGEVMLIDWGAANAHRKDGDTLRVAGTPAYMAPEHFFGDSPTPAFDIYSLGVTLFHVLLLRKPVVCTHNKQLLERKLSGDYDLPSLDEMPHVPRPLIGTALRAMAVNPQDRFSDVAEMARAIREFQAGRSEWGAPLVVETFVTDNYLSRWVEGSPGDFSREPGRLVSRGSARCLLYYRKRLAPGVAIEFEGEMLAGSPRGDLSVVWTDDDVLGTDDVKSNPKTLWSLQAGAFDNLMTGIYRDWSQGIAVRPLSLRPATKYLIRAEIHERGLRLFIDGELVAEHDGPFPLGSGYIALFSYGPGKAFSNVRLYERGFPERLAPTAIGDAFFDVGDFANAATHYARVASLVPYAAIAEEARFKQGLALLNAHDEAHCEAVWQTLSSESWCGLAALFRLDGRFRAGCHSEVIEALEQLCAAESGTRRATIHRWVQYVTQLASTDPLKLGPYVELRKRAFPCHVESATAAAAALVALGEWEVVVSEYSDQHVQFVAACSLLGRFELVVKRYPDIPWLRDTAVLRMNGFDDTKLTPAYAGLVRLFRGDVDAANPAADCTEALLIRGEFERLLEQAQLDVDHRCAALRGLGRSDEAMRLGDARAFAQADAGAEAREHCVQLPERLYLLHHLAVRGFVSGDRSQYRHFRDEAALMPCGAFWDDVWVHRFVILPLIDQLLGSAGGLERAMRLIVSDYPNHWFGKGQHLARFVLGESTEAEFRSQPFRLLLAPRLILARAFRAEYRGEAAEARIHYLDYWESSAPIRLSDSVMGDPVMSRWVRYRLG